MGLEFFEPWEQVVDLSRGPEWATWFVGGKLNIAWNCVHRWHRGDRVAAVFRGEDGARRELTFAELSDAVTRLAERLVELGVEPGDRVAIYLPMSPEAAIASHACAHIGAVQVPVFSGLRGAGGRAAARRLRGEGRDHGAIVAAARARGADARDPRGGAAGGAGARARRRRAVGRRGRRLPRHARAARGRRPSIRTSSPTPPGRPASRRACSTSRAASSSRSRARPATRRTRTPDDVIHFATDMGWIMGPWTVVGGGAMGATIVFAEGAPDWPPDRLWRLVEEERVTILGCSPTLIRALIPHGEPAADLSSLRTFVTTGEPWNPDPYRWLFERVGGGRCPIVNCSGGTEVGAVLPLARSVASRSRSARSAGRRPGWRWTSSTPRGGRSSARARSASSSAGSRSRG